MSGTPMNIPGSVGKQNCRKTDLELKQMLPLKAKNVRLMQKAECEKRTSTLYGICDYYNMSLRKFGLEVVDWLRTGLGQFSPPSGPWDWNIQLEPIIGVKRQAQVILKGVKKGPQKQIEEVIGGVCINELVNELQAVDVSDNDETPFSFHIGENTPWPTIRRGMRAWKKEAR